MAWHLTEDPDAFLAAAGGLLRADPVRHTVPLSVVDTLRRRGPAAFGAGTPRLGWWDTGAGAAAACLLTPGHPLLVTALPDAAAAALPAALPGPVRAVDGPEPAARAVAAARGAPGTAPARRRNRLYRLGTLTPRPAPGTARTARPADRDLLLDWWRTFQREIGEDPGRATDQVADKIAAGGCTLWLDPRGAPAAMASHTRPAAGTARIQAVFTAPGCRGRGYGGAVTAAAAGAAHRAGATTVVLFADLANPVSNRLYERLGFLAVHDTAVVECPS